MRTGAMIGTVLLLLLPFAGPLYSQDTSAGDSGKPPYSVGKATDTLGRDISGDGQLGTVRDILSRPIVVSVDSAGGTPARGVTVVFSILSEPEVNSQTGERAVVVTPSVVTDERGYAKASVRLGGEPGRYRIAASVEGTELCLTFGVQGMRKGWPAFMVFNLAGGLALFLYGLNFVGRSLNRGTGGRLRHMIFSLSERRHVGILVGALLALLVQSSSATVAMLASFANTGLLNLSQSMGLILGADLGTVITVQVISFRITNLAPLLVALGFVLMAFGHRNLRYAGRAVFGAGMVFLGLLLMSDAVSPLEASPGFRSILLFLSERPLLTLVFAGVFAALVRSSAGPIGVAIMLGYGNMIELEGAVAIVLGANLGSALTALLGSVGSTTEGRRVAVAHALFKFTVVVTLFLLLESFAALVSAIGGSTARQIANAHAILNVTTVIIFLPILSPVERFVKAVTKGGPERKESRPKYLDETVLGTPSLAMGQAQREATRMADIVCDMFTRVRDVLRSNDEILGNQIVAEDDNVDELSEKTTTYLTRISQEELSEEQSERGVALLYIVDELESIGDVVSKSLMVYAKKKIDRGFYFSSEGFAEINAYHEYACETIKMAITSFSTWDKRLARETADRRAEGAQRLSQLHDAHIERLRREKPESLDTSSVHLDLIRDLERVNSHACNIAEAMLGKT